MKISCPQCKKIFNIPYERLPQDQTITFLCPSCKQGKIVIDPLSGSSRTDAPPSGDDQIVRPTGDALKKMILRGVMDLPPMPQTVHKAREIMADSKSDFKKLADLFETDQAIATKILKIANSPYYGMSGRVSTIQHASVVLGHKALGELITMGGTASLLGDRLNGYGLDAGALWKHSLAVAFGARCIADKKEPSLSNDAFTAGLIHDSGKLILDPYIVERWDQFEAFMNTGNNTFLEAEKKILELDHSEVAAEVCTQWAIPKWLIVSIRHHHHPSESEGNTLAYIVHVADSISMMAGLGLGLDSIHYQMDTEALGVLSLTEEDVGEIMGTILNAVKQISTVEKTS